MNEKKSIFSLGENKLTTNYESILNLGNQPWGNGFIKEEEIGKEPAKSEINMLS